MTDLLGGRGDNLWITSPFLWIMAFHPTNAKDRFGQGREDASLELFGAYKNKLLIGIIATRNEGNHIALFFVKGEYHKQGIGLLLIILLML